MLSEKLQNIFISITTEASEMVFSHVDKDDLAVGIDYATIYAQSAEEFDKISKELKSNGTVALERSTGDYYKLDSPISIPTGTILHCRVRRFDKEHFERGYVDFEVKNYQSFKNKYLSRLYFSLLNGEEEMVRLRDPKFTVRAYFPSGKF